MAIVNPEDRIVVASQDPAVIAWQEAQERAAEHEDVLFAESVAVRQWLEDLHWDREAERNGAN